MCVCVEGGCCCECVCQALDCGGPENNHGCFVTAAESRLGNLNQEDEGDVMSVCAEGSYQSSTARRRERARLVCMMGWTENRDPISIQCKLR